MSWLLKRTTQCAKCPWRKDVNPHDIPNGYCPTKHANLTSTIAKPGDVSSILAPALHVMACHEMYEAHCIGWLVNQVGEGNNLPLRIHMMSCANGDKIKTIGKQHSHFRQTLPRRAKKK